MATDSKTVMMVPLNGSNYPTWKLQCKMALIREGVWNIVNGSEAAPGVGSANYQKYSTRRDRALATIVLSIDPSLLYLIRDPEDPAVVWTKLGDQFQKKTWANKLQLRKRLHSLQLKEGDSVQKHIKDMTEIFNELTIVGVDISDEDRVVYLLASLPDSFCTLVTALEANAEVPSMEVVTERLLHEERRRSERGTSTKSEAGAMTVKRYHKKGKGPRCHNCQKFGHIQRNCPQDMKSSQMEERNRKSARKDTHRVNKVEVNSDSDTDTGLVMHHEVNSTGVTGHSNCWIVDSGATCHICHDRELFVDLKSLTTKQKVTLGDGRSLQAAGVGIVQLELVLPNKETRIRELHNVLYVPGLSYNLLSVAKMTDRGKKVNFNESLCRVVDKKKRVIAIAVKEGGLYYLSYNQPQLGGNVNLIKESNERIWHQRFGHLGENSLQKLAKEGLVDGFNYDVSKTVGFCESCVKGKIHRSCFPTTGRKRGEELLSLVHSDVCGKVNTKSLSGAEYFLTFIDDKTHFTWVYFLKHKHEVFQQFLKWKAMVEKSSGHKLKVIRTDNGGEFTSTEFQEYLQEEGVRHELTIPKTPEQNGVAERMNRTLVETVRSMLLGAKLPQRFWAETLSTAVYLRNCGPTKAVSDMTPYEAWYGKRPKVNHLRVFGCTTYSHIAKEERRKLDSKARKCILLGYGNETKGYRLYDQTTRKILYSRDVTFNEQEHGFGSEEQYDSASEKPLIEMPVQDDLSSEEDDEVTDEPQQSEESQPRVDGTSQGVPNQRRSGRATQRPDYYGEWINSAEECDPEPISVTEAMSTIEKEKWKKAMNTEMESINDNQVWDLVKLPKGKRAVGCKWVFKRKLGADGTVERYKARLVAQGFSQRFGIDYDETFCPVVRFESLRTLIAIAVQKGLKIHQMDVTAAFLNGTIDEEVYMKQPDGFVAEGKQDMVCKLKHSLYGLKQAPRCWNFVLDKELKEMGLEQSSSDPCVYTSSGGADSLMVGVYVDDIVICGKSICHIEEMKKALSEKFKIKDLGELKYFLGVNVLQNHQKGAVWIGQQTYIENMLKRFGFENAKSISTPVDVGVKLCKATDKSELVDQSLYQSAVGSLLYLATKTRPDITYAVSNVAKYSSKPAREHWAAVKRIFRYLKGTSSLGLLYKCNSLKSLVGYSDADWGGDCDDHKSTSGYCFQIGGTVISWRSKKQPCVALSTTEAEYIALAGAAQEAVWLRELCAQLNTEQHGPTLIHEDNQSAISMSKNPQFHGKAKHIGIKFHFIREQVNSKKVELKYCRTEEMLADMFTKGLGTTKLVRFREMAGVQDRTVCSEEEC